MAYSDDNGAFTLHIDQVGSGAVSASKEMEGYPDAVLAYYGRTGYSSLQQITAATTRSSGSLLLKFGEPQGTLVWHVVDALSGKPIRAARAELQMVDNADITGSLPVDEEGHILFVLPRSPMKVSIGAPGYASQFSIERDQAVSDAHARVPLKKEVKLMPANVPQSGR